MEIITPPIIKRFVGLPRYEPKNIDSSALMDFLKCNQYYFLRHVLGYTEKNTPIYFAFGSAYHKFREVIEIEYKKLGKQEANNKLDLIIAEGINAALKEWGTTRDLPDGVPFYWLTKAKLIRACIVGGNRWRSEKLAGNIEVLETEQPFNILLPDSHTRSGRFDQIIKMNGSIWGRDFKTTSKDIKWFERSLEPNDQFAGYTYAQSKLTGQYIKGQLVEVVLNPKPTKPKPGSVAEKEKSHINRDPEIETKIVTFTPEQLKVWEDEQSIHQKNLGNCREVDVYPKNPKSCNYCIFHSVCKLKGENQQLLQLKSNFKVDVWDNTKGDTD